VQDVVGRNLMAQIHQRGVRADPEHHTLHDAHEGILRTEISQERHDRSRPHGILSKRPPGHGRVIGRGGGRSCSSRYAFHLTIPAGATIKTSLPKWRNW
jgi:hypothetical protein